MTQFSRSIKEKECHYAIKDVQYTPVLNLKSHCRQLNVFGTTSLLLIASTFRDDGDKRFFRLFAVLSVLPFDAIAFAGLIDPARCRFGGLVVDIADDGRLTGAAALPKHRSHISVICST